MNMDFKVAEITLQYKPTCEKQSKVFGSEEAYNILLPTFKEGTIESTGNMLRYYISTKQMKLLLITRFQRED